MSPFQAIRAVLRIYPPANGWVVKSTYGFGPIELRRNPDEVVLCTPVETSLGVRVIKHTPSGTHQRVA